jgi:hypothetical protein
MNPAATKRNALAALLRCAELVDLAIAPMTRSAVVTLWLPASPGGRPQVVQCLLASLPQALPAAECTALVRALGGLRLRDCASLVGDELRLRLPHSVRSCQLRLACQEIELLDDRGFRCAPERLLAAIP